MAEVAIDGVVLGVAIDGAGDPPFVFVHGLACDRRSWQPQFEALSVSHRCVSIDLRGRGESAAVPPYGTGQAADDVAAVIRHLGLSPAIVVGHSLGGLVSLLVNQRYPDVVTGIVMADPPLTAAASGRLAELGERIRAEGVAAAMAPVVASWVVDTTPASVRDYVEEVVANCPAEVAAGMLANGGVFQQEMTGLLQAADAKPFMVLWPTRPAGNPENLRGATTFLRQEPIADSGHFLQLEHPEVTTALLRAFVDDVRRDPRLA